MNVNFSPKQPFVGVGLRHPHIPDALTESMAVDFVEVHSENFFAQGGALPHLIQQIAAKYPVSLHSTAAGLGSETGVPDFYQQQLEHLAQLVTPILMSDHAAFSWGKLNNSSVHAGDLLPLAYNEQSLAILATNVDQLQQRLGRPLLIENLSAYLEMPGSTFSEPEFLTRLQQQTQCGLLVDLNNILVNAHNQGEPEPLSYAKEWLRAIPAQAVGEIHLAGYSQVSPEQLAVDDHSQPVSELCWQLYEYAIQLFGHVPTLIEWDNQLPDWQVLVQQAQKAKRIAQEVL